MTIIQRIRQLNRDRDWTDYRLAKEAGLSQSTISNFLSRGSYPSFYTLERICRAYGISLTRFFAGCEAEDDMTEELRRLTDLYTCLPKYEREKIIQDMTLMVAGEGEV